MKRLTTLLLVALLASILAACGGSTSDTGSASSAPIAASAPAAVPSAAASVENMASPAASAAASGAASADASGAASAAGGTASAACTPQGSPVDRLVWWTRAAEGEPLFDSFKTIAQNYQQAGGSPVEIVTVIDAEFRNKMSIAAPAGEGPDVFGPIAHDWLGEFALQGIAQPLTQDQIQNADDIIATAYDAATADGKLYGIPIWVESVALIYNKDLVPEPPATWEELVTTANELTQGDTYGFAFPLLEQYHEGPFFNGFGSYIFDYQNGEFNTEDIGLNNAAGVEAASFLRDMYYQGQPKMPEVVIDRANMHAVVEGMMEEGKIAMTINGPWREGPLQRAGINYGVAKLPTLPNGEPMVPFLGVQVFGVNAYSENQAAAVDFANYLTCTDNVALQFAADPKAPVRQSALETEAVQANPNIETWNAQAAEGVPMPNIPAMGQVWKPWGDAMDAIVGQNAPDEQIQPLLDTTVEQIKAAIAQTQ